MRECLLAPLLLLPAWPPLQAQQGVRFEVTVAQGLLAKPTDGRLLVVIANRNGQEPRFTIGETGMNIPPVLGRDVRGLTPGVMGVIDPSAQTFPIASINQLTAGEYFVQAVFDINQDLRLVNAPGNLYSQVKRVQLDPAKGGTVRLELTEQMPPDTVPADHDNIRYIKLESKLLSKFHGRPMYLRAGLALPAGFDQELGRRYPLRVHIGGYGTRYTGIERFRNPSPNGPRMLILLLDGAGPYGDPYQVNSANNGPYGDAITQELIPYIETKFRGIGQGFARFTDGHSTGGWVSLALQVFYPDFFNGCWSFAPDPVDFRSYELINIYQDTNAYVNRHGFERPAKRETNGETIYTVRHECQIENVLGMGDSWTRSGKDWCAWNATFGPRGADGFPRPLWEPQTGQIDRSVTEHWKQYDLRLVLQNNWPTLGPKLRGKLHIYVGDADDYFLNNAVHRLEQFLSRANPPYEGRIVFGPGQGHGFHPQRDSETMNEMIEAMRRTQK